MNYHRGDTLVAQRTYAYDQLGRPNARTITRQGSTRTDAYTYNNRSELIGDVVDGTALNGWDYDRAAAASSSGVASNKKACANQLNQYTAIEDQEGTFQPTYDADGNQTRVKTSTGIWNVTYNAKNRPVLFVRVPFPLRPAKYLDLPPCAGIMEATSRSYHVFQHPQRRNRWRQALLHPGSLLPGE